MKLNIRVKQIYYDDNFDKIIDIVDINNKSDINYLNEIDSTYKKIYFIYKINIINENNFKIYSKKYKIDMCELNNIIIDNFINKDNKLYINNDYNTEEDEIIKFDNNIFKLKMKNEYKFKLNLNDDELIQFKTEFLKLKLYNDNF